MKLTTILNQARSGEVKALSAKDKTDKLLITYINLGMIALYKRFSVSTEEAILALKVDTPLYVLDSTDLNVTVNNAAMLDDDVLTIISALDEVGEPVFINDKNEETSIITTSYDTIKVPYVFSEDFIAGESKIGTSIAVTYRRNPILLDEEALTDVTTGVLTDTTASIRLPMQLLEPMLHYIGYRAHGSVKGTIQDENNTHYMRFVASCKTIDKEGVMNLEGLPSRDVKQNGFI